MDRLTERRNGKLTLKGQFPTIQDTLSVITNRLELYEDLEEQGRLIKLPCKVGDIVYSVNTVNSSIYEHEIKNFMITDTGEYTYAQNAKSGYQFKLSDFDKTVFLTREEAERALRALEVE